MLKSVGSYLAGVRSADHEQGNLSCPNFLFLRDLLNLELSNRRTQAFLISGPCRVRLQLI